MQSAKGSILLTERGDTRQVDRHLDFRIFACMNPSTDVGKRDLPSTLRSYFTEFHILSIDDEIEVELVPSGSISSSLDAMRSSSIDRVLFDSKCMAVLDLTKIIRRLLNPVMDRAVVQLKGNYFI